MAQQKCSFRQRGYQLSDDSVVMVFGQDPAPSDPTAKLLWDNWVIESIDKEVYSGQDLPPKGEQ